MGMTRAEVLETLCSQYYEFAPREFEGRYYSDMGYGWAVVAYIGMVDWEAKIGGCPPDREDKGLGFVASYGEKLSKEDAVHFFPGIDFPYRE